MALPAGDQYWYSKVLGLHCDGTNGSTTFTDVKGKTVTAVGNAQISTAQYPALTGKSSSAYFDGTGDYLTLSNSTDFTFPGDFTIQFFVRFSGGAGSQIWLYDDEAASASVYGIVFIKNNSDKIVFVYMPDNAANKSDSGNLVYVTGTTTVALNTWYRVQARRIGTTVALAVDGTQEATATLSSGVGIYNPGGTKWIGGRNTSTNYLNGYLSEFEIYKGVGLSFNNPTVPFADTYLRISGITKNSSGVVSPNVVRVMRCSDNTEAGDVVSDPSTGEYAVEALDASPHYAVCHSDVFDTHWSSTSLLLHMNDTGLTDEKGRSITLGGGAARSATQSKFGGYSAYFDGTGDYLSVTGESLGTGDFTVEGWVYPVAAASTCIIFDTRTADSDSTGFAFYFRTTGKLTFIYGAGVVVEGVSTYSANTWYHVAAVRISGVIKLYMNGVLEASFSQGNTYSNTGWKIGHQWNVTGSLGAFYLDEFRVTKAGRYTKPFTPYEAAFPHGYTATENAQIYDNITPY